MPLRAFDSRCYHPCNELSECSTLPKGVLQQLRRLLSISELADRACIQEELHVCLEFTL
jgi:hypothetical protein